MSALRRTLSLLSLLASGAAGVGCYDLSDPTGPHREDFVQQAAQPEDPNAQQQGEGTRAEPEPAQPVRSAEEETTLRLAVPGAEAAPIVLAHDEVRAPRETR